MFNVFHRIDVEDSGHPETTVELVPHVTHNVKVVGLDNRTVDGFRVSGRFPKKYKQSLRESDVINSREKFDREIEVVGLDPDEPRLFVALQPEEGVGAAQVFHGADPPREIKLKKCVAIRGRLSPKVVEEIQEGMYTAVLASIQLHHSDRDGLSDRQQETRLIARCKIQQDGSFALSNVLRWDRVTLEFYINGSNAKSIEVDTNKKSADAIDLGIVNF